MIADQDISIVVQGPVLGEAAFDITSTTTARVCQRLRKLFPESELILSTWEGSDVSGILCDKVVLNQDPGATWFNLGDKKLLNNCNRLIVSTYQGIQAASRPYVLKVRSDLFLLSKSFLTYFDKFPAYDERYKFVKSRIIAFSLYSIKAHRTCLFTMKRPYHISDWAYFGYKEDLVNLYDIPLTYEPYFSQWFLKRCKSFFDIEPHRLWKMPPEQYVTTCFLRKFTPIRFEHTTDLSDDNVLKSERVLANNFLVLDQTQFSLISLKYVNAQLLFESLLSSTAIFYSTWLQDYYIYCQASKRGSYFLHGFQIIFRRVVYKIFNFILRNLNRKNQWVQKFMAWIIKKIK